MKHAFSFLVILIVSSASNAGAQISSNDSFVLDQSVIASGGGRSSTDNFTVYGTAGQSISGVWSTAPSNGLHGGFWNGAAPLAPTAAAVELGGRVTAADGRPIGNASLSLIEASGTTHSARTNPFGWYRFDGIAAGQTVFVRVSARRFTFAEPMLVYHVVDNFNELNFSAVASY
jgi:Carboxypeptidase regulatory-like domain